MNAFLPDQTRISKVTLRTRKVERAAQFYRVVLGLTAAHDPGEEAIRPLDTENPALIVLNEDRDAPQRRPRSVGLYRFAIRYPRRRDLAQAYRRIVNSGWPIIGASDHGVSEAIYLTDADGNGVELYADKPRASWPWRDGQISMVSRTLDLDRLLEQATDGLLPESPPKGTLIGHIHFHVANLAAAERFYSDFLGLAVTQRTYPGALFFAAGSYHHHIGANTWAGSASPPPKGVGLISYRLEVPCAEVLYCLGHRAPLLGYESHTHPDDGGALTLQIRDPSGCWLEIQAAGATSWDEAHRAAPVV